jgi:hypothetical protein
LDLKYVERMKDLLQQKGEVGGDAHMDEVLAMQLHHVRDILTSEPSCKQRLRCERKRKYSHESR